MLLWQIIRFPGNAPNRISPRRGAGIHFTEASERERESESKQTVASKAQGKIEEAIEE